MRFQKLVSVRSSGDLRFRSSCPRASQKEEQSSGYLKLWERVCCLDMNRICFINTRSDIIPAFQYIWLCKHIKFWTNFPSSISFNYRLFSSNCKCQILFNSWVISFSVQQVNGNIVPFELIFLNIEYSLLSIFLPPLADISSCFCFVFLIFFFSQKTRLLVQKTLKLQASWSGFKHLGLRHLSTWVKICYFLFSKHENTWKTKSKL